MNGRQYKNKRPRKRSWTGGNLEDREQGKLCSWIKNRYPDAWFKTDRATGVKLSPYQAKKIYAQRMPVKGWPDLEIMEARGEYAALYIELKATGQKVLKKDGTLLSDSHLKQQAKTHAGLIDRGYLAGFCVGLENAKKAIIAYMESDFETLKEYLIHGH